MMSKQPRVPVEITHVKFRTVGRMSHALKFARDSHSHNIPLKVRGVIGFELRNEIYDAITAKNYLET